MNSRFLRLVVGVGLGVGVVLLGGVSTAAYACSCAGGSIRGYAAGADAVFAGTIERRRDPMALLPVRGSGDRVYYEIVVDAVYQGRVGERAELASASSGASCGLEVDLDHRYVFFASRDRSGELEANLCGGTFAAPAFEVPEVEQVLGPPTPPDPGLQSGSGGSVTGMLSGWALPAIAPAALVALLFVGGWTGRAG
ncbi:MAG: hypothetical protein M3P83_08040 [Actinomycetota bacterium]|nr:hypothetical protein [Actinomycetota bacterium]